MRTGRKGSILIVTLWIMVFFGALVAVFSARVNSQTATIRRLTESVRARTLAYSGVGYVIGLIREPGALAAEEAKPLVSSLWLNNPALFRNVALYEGSTDLFSIAYQDELQQRVYGLRDEESRININKVPAEVFRRLYTSAEGMTLDDANNLAQETVKYRQKNLFASVEELQLVPGMNGAVLGKILPYLTVYGNGLVNFNTVSKDTLLALGIDVSLTSRIVDYREFRRSELAQQKNAQEEPFNDLGDLTQKIGVSPEEEKELQNIGSIWTGKSATFRFLSLLNFPDGRVRAGFECVADRRGEILFLANA
jgi:general secretion pathway protein K